MNTSWEPNSNFRGAPTPPKCALCRVTLDEGCCHFCNGTAVMIEAPPDPEPAVPAPRHLEPPPPDLLRRLHESKCPAEVDHGHAVIAREARISEEAPQQTEIASQSAEDYAPRAAAGRDFEAMTMSASHSFDLLQIIRSMCTDYAQLEIVRVHRRVCADCYVINVRGPGSRHCMNKGTAHS